MEMLQLELNLEDKNSIEIKLDHMQKRLNDAILCSDRVRKKLFAERKEYIIRCDNLEKKVTELEIQLRKVKNEESLWIYSQADCFFNVSNG